LPAFNKASDADKFFHIVADYFGNYRYLLIRIDITELWALSVSRQKEKENEATGNEENSY
jgi:hypothetical protein